MKKSFFLAAFAAALALVGCQKQSELDFDDIKTKATVQGYVYIDLGYIQEGTGFAKLNKPAEGVAVAVKVDYQKYDKDAAGGQKFFEAVCDANGFYQVEIPVGQEAISGMNVYTRPFVGKYYDLVNGAIQEVEVSFTEESTSVDIESGKVFTAANMIVTKDVEKPILTRNQKVKVSGKIVEKFEKKEYVDKENPDKGYYGVVGTNNATQTVTLVATFTNTDTKFNGQELIYNLTTGAGGAYELTADLYDAWDINKTEVKIEAKSYLNKISHYYEKYDDDDKKYISKTQEVSGYFERGEVQKPLSDGSLLIGCVVSDLVVEFVPDYAKETIYGIGNPDIDKTNDKGIIIYKSNNPLGWAY